MILKVKDVLFHGEITKVSIVSQLAIRTFELYDKRNKGQQSY